MISEERYEELLEELAEGHDVLFDYNGNKYFYSHCGENGDYLQKDLDGPRIVECGVFKGLHDIKIDGIELIDVLKMCDIDSVY
jgi:hypothetical protein